MKFFLILLLLCIGLFSYGSDWEYSGDSPNRITTTNNTEEAIKLEIARAEKVLWREADGVAFEKTKDGKLFTTKIIAGSAKYSLKYQFPQPLNKIKFTTPFLRGVDLSKGNCTFEYSLDGKNFMPLMIIDNNNSTVGGNVSPKESEWIEIPENNKELTLRVILNGYVGQIEWFGDGGFINYTNRLDNKARANVTLHPDNSKKGYLYYYNMRPFFACNAKEVDTVTVKDLGRNTLAQNLTLTVMKNRLLAELPKLEPGIYQVDFKKGEQTLDTLRIGLVDYPRMLTLAEKRRSPFGIIGVMRTNGFRESVPLEGPEIGKMVGVYQERTGAGSWCEVAEAGPDKLKFTPIEKTINNLIDSGVVIRGNLAWSPVWAVDLSRVKKDDWAGRYPPKQENLKEYANFCRQMAEYYRGVIVPEYEIWNEPNNEPYGEFKGTFSEFVDLCRTAAEAIHSVQPEARMILGTTGDADVGYIVRLLKAGLSKHFSLVDIHPYRHTNQGPEDGLLGDINRLKDAIRKYGDNQGIIFSELGWPTTRVDRPSYQKVSEFEQAVFNTRTLLISLAAGVERVHFHMMEDWGTNPDEPEFNFGFFKVDGTPKLAIVAMGAATRNLEGAKFLGRMKSPEYIHAWYWQTPWEPNKYMVTVWSDAQRLPDAEAVVLSGTIVGAVDVWGGKVTKDRIKVENNKIIVKPSADPIFVILDGKLPTNLRSLPLDLRANLIKRASSKKGGKGVAIDYKKLSQSMIPAQETKAMAGAGIGQNAPEIIAQAEANATFDSWYDDKGFTLAVNVNNGRPMQNTQDGWWIWAGDCLRLFMGNSEANYLDGNLHQICIAPTTKNGKPAAVLISYDAATGLSAGDTVPAEIEAKNTETGWAMTVTIPWSFFKAVPKSGDVWRFDIGLPGAMWNNRKGDKWNNPGEWGEIKFN